MKKLTKDQVLEIIRKDIKGSSLRKTAIRIGVTPAYLSDIVNGRREISEKIAALYGFERTIKTEVFFTKVA